jgi:hypothetical protein
MVKSRSFSFTGLLPDSASITQVLGRSRVLAVAGCLALTLAACGGGGGSSPGFGSGSSLIASGTPTTGTGGSTAPVTPIYSIGNGSGTGFKDGIIETNKTTLESGETATLRVNIVDQANNPPTVDLTVNFTSTCSSTGLATFGTVSQVTRGLFSVSYANGGCDKAEDVITATLAQNNKQASVKIKAVGPAALSVSFVSATQTQLALAGIGGNESSELVFKVAGPQGVPVVGKLVSFSLNTKVGGASILSGRETGTTDQTGQVRTIVSSGTVAGPISVKAVHNESGRQGISPDIVISTGVPESRRLTLSNDNFNPKGAFNTSGVEVTFSIIASDAFGNNPIDGTRISFVTSESGNIQSSCLLANGVCSSIWRSSNPRPANMRITILAYTNGAEDFVDSNGNSVFDAGDAGFTDLGEPYADENENGSYTLNEFFFDSNKNGVRDGGNGKWDGPCLSKVNASALCTGESNVSIYQSQTITLPTNTPRILSLGSFPTPGTTISIQQGGSVSFANMIIADNNTVADALGSNPLPSGTNVTFSIDGPGVTLRGLTTSRIANNVTFPTGPYGTSLVAAIVAPTADLPVSSVLLITFAVPGEPLSQFAWPVVVTR